MLLHICNVIPSVSEESQPSLIVGGKSLYVLDGRLEDGLIKNIRKVELCYIRSFYNHNSELLLKTDSHF